MLVCVGIPCLDGKPYANTVDSLLAEQLLGYGRGVHFLVLWEIGCSLIGVARNKIAKRFLDQKEADCLVFVDSDISWKGGDLARLAQQPHDVIGGTYRAKRDDDYYHISGTPRRVGDLYEVDGLPGGFLKISRRALETIDAAPYLDENRRPMRDFFPVGMIDGQMYGEDYGFCRLWTNGGGKVLLDPSIKLRHHDGLRAYSGDPLAWLDTTHGREAA
jgi:hypothetical protein